MSHCQFAMTPPTQRYPGNKGFLTGPTDNDAQTTRQSIRYGSDGTSQSPTRETPSLATPTIHTRHIPISEVTA